MTDGVDRMPKDGLQEDATADADAGPEDPPAA
jgi:hypothetical protein